MEGALSSQERTLYQLLSNLAQLNAEAQVAGGGGEKPRVPYQFVVKARRILEQFDDNTAFGPVRSFLDHVEQGRIATFQAEDSGADEEPD